MIVVRKEAWGDDLGFHVHVIYIGGSTYASKEWVYRGDQA